MQFSPDFDGIFFRKLLSESIKNGLLCMGIAAGSLEWKQGRQAMNTANRSYNTEMPVCCSGPPGDLARRQIKPGDEVSEPESGFESAKHMARH